MPERSANGNRPDLPAILDLGLFFDALTARFFKALKVLFLIAFKLFLMGAVAGT